MNSDGWKFKRWLDKDEAAQELSEKTGTKLSSADALHCALDRGVPFVVYVPSGTPDCQGRHIMERGLWELMTEGARGEPGRQQVEHEINQNVPVVGIDGAWVERDRVQRQLRPPSPSDFVLEALDFHYSAIPDACTLGLRREDVEDLAETLNKEKPTPSAPKSADDRDKDLDPRERNSLMHIIAGLVHEFSVDLTRVSKAAGQIEAMTVRAGHRVSARAAVEKLKEIKELLAKK